MKKQILLIASIFAAAFSLKAQSPGATCSSSYSVASSVYLPNIMQNASDGWFVFSANSGSTSITIKNIAPATNKKIRKINIQSGTCSGLVSIAVDSLSSPTDSTLQVKIYNLSSGNIYYITTLRQTSIDCPSCTNDTALFHLLTVPVYGPCQVTGTCTTGPACEYVCNGSFENLSSAPSTITFAGLIPIAAGWSTCLNSTPDLHFTTAASPDVQVPCNFMGFQNALNFGSAANSYAGIYTSSNSNGQYAEYIQNQLTTPLPLTANPSFYEVSFYVSRAEQAPNDNVSLDVFLQTGPTCNSATTTPLTFSGLLIPNTAVYTETNLAVLNDAVNWRQIKFIYCTYGGEDDLIIGSYDGLMGASITAPTSTCAGITLASLAGGYLYIDDVSIKDMGSFNLAFSPNPVCPNTPINFSVTTGCSNFTTSPTYFNWNFGDGNTLAAASGTVSHPYTLPGTYVVTVTINAASSVSICGVPFMLTQTVTVISGPTVTAVASPVNICPGGSSTLTASGAVTYTWSTSATSAVTAVTPGATTVYTVTGTGPNSCKSSATVAVIVNPNPVINITASSQTICSGTSATLTASGASTYTWSPGGSSLNPIVVSPITTTIYTVTGTSASGCIGTKTISITIIPGPTITVTKSPTGNVCPFTPVTLTYNGALSYVTQPGTLTTNPIIVTPSVSTIYTITGTNASGCTTSTTALVFVYNINITVAASPSIICSTGTSTLTHSNLGSFSSFTWQPGGSSAPGPYIVSPTVTTTYTLFGNYSFLGCPISRTVTVNVIPTPTVIPIASPSVICSGQVVTLSASGAFNYTWSPPGSTGAVITVTPTTSTTYTIVGKIGPCTDTKTINVIVNPTPTVSISASSTTLCGGVSSATLTASGATSYTWSTGPNTAAIVVSPTSNTIYTVTGSNGSCVSTKTILIVVVPTPSTIAVVSTNTYICNTGTTSVTLSTNISNPSLYNFFWSPGGFTTPSIVVTPTDNTVYTVNVTDNVGCGSSLVSSLCVDLVSNLCCSSSNTTLTNYTITGIPYSSLTAIPRTIVISGVLTVSVNTKWSMVTARMLSGSRIDVLPGVLFYVDNCRFFSCQDMWQGIVLQQSAVGTASIYALQSKFEDAYQAVKLDANNSAYNTNIQLEYCYFNKNFISVDLEKVSSIVSGNLLATKICTYITQPSNTSPGASLKCSSFYSPTIIGRGSVGWKLDNVAYGLAIGTTTAIIPFDNFFENLDNGIYMNQSGFEVYNARFKNMDGVNRFYGSNPYRNVGAAIYALCSIATATNTNHKLFVRNGGFQNVWRGVATYGMTDTKTVESAFTGTTTSSPLCTSGCIGNFAVFYNDAKLVAKTSTNTINNFANGIANYFSTTSAAPGFSLGIGNNTITANANGFSSLPIEVMDASNNFTASVGYPISIAANKINNSTNGIFIENIKSGARASNNLMTVGAGSLSSSFTGIFCSGTSGALIDNNKINGTSTSLSNLRGINMALSPLCEVACNTLTTLQQDLVYSGPNTSTLTGFHNNVFGTCFDGLVLELNGIVGVQGSSVTASGNIWPITATYVNSQTFTDGPGSAATLTALWVNTGVTTNPTNNQTGGSAGLHDYNASGALNITGFASIVCPTPLTAARVFTVTPPFIPPAQMQPAMDAQYNGLINTSTTYSVYNSETHNLHNKHAYSAIKRGDITTSDANLLAFYNAHKTATTGQLVEVDSLLENFQLPAALSANAAITPTCNIDQNQKNLNTLLAKQLANNLNPFTVSEINLLWSIAKKCPFTDGNAVYQCRALLRIIHNTYIEFVDSCTSEANNGRLLKPSVPENKILEQENSFVLYPNPNNGSMNLMYQLKTVQKAVLSIYDVTGKLIFKKELNANYTRMEIDLKEIKEGMYYYKIENADIILKTDKLIIIK